MGLLHVFPTISFNIKVIDLHCKILTRYKKYIFSSKLKKYKNSLFKKIQRYVFYFYACEQILKIMHVDFIKNKNYIFIIL